MASVLIVDDEPSITQTLGAFFERSGGHVVTAAHTGAEGLALFQRTRPDLVLLDVRLPDMRGERLAGLVRAERPGLPVLLVSGA